MLLPSSCLGSEDPCNDQQGESSHLESLGRLGIGERLRIGFHVGHPDPEAEPVWLLSFGSTAKGESHTGITTGRLGDRVIRYKIPIAWSDLHA